jgi:hypothetical protein
VTRVRRVVSGGQTGADRGGLDAAIGLGIEHGGWCPLGRRAEDGAIPERYRLRETASDDYAERTGRNVVDSDGTVVFTVGEATGGSELTLRLAREHGRPRLHVDLGKTADERAAQDLREWLASVPVAVLNVAGSRESGAPGIGERVYRIVREALAHPERGHQGGLFGPRPGA